MSSAVQHPVTTEDRSGYQNVGMILGPAIFAIMMAFSGMQTVMDPVAWKTAAVGLWMAAWWATETASALSVGSWCHARSCQCG